MTKFRFDDNIDKIIEDRANKESKSKSQVISEMLNDLLKETPKEETVIQLPEETKPKKGEMVDKLLEWNTTQALVKQMTGGSNEMLDFNKLLSFMAVKELIKPQQQQPQMDWTKMFDLFLKLKESKSNDNDMMKMFMQMMVQQQQLAQQQAQMQQQQNAQLMQLFFGKQFQEMKKQVEETKRETKEGVLRALERLENAFTQQSQSGGLTEELERYSRLRSVLKEWAEAEGLAKEEITDKSGKINVGKILDRLFRMGEKIAEKLPAAQPPLKPVQGIAVPMDSLPPEVQAQFEQQSFEQPKQEPMDFEVAGPTEQPKPIKQEEPNIVDGNVGSNSGAKEDTEGGKSPKVHRRRSKKSKTK